MVYSSKKNRNSKTGYSLVEVLVAVGLISIVGLGIATMMQNQFKATSTISKNLDFNSLISEIQMYLSKEDTCARLFSNANMSPLPMSVPSYPYTLPTGQQVNLSKLSYQNSDLLVIGTPINNLTATILKFDKVIDVLPPSGTNRRYVLNFLVKVTKSGQNYGSSEKEKNFTIMTEVNSSNQVVNCGASGNSMFAICMEMGGIYTAGGSPACDLVPKYQ